MSGNNYRARRFELRFEIEAVLQELIFEVHMGSTVGQLPPSPQSVAERILELVDETS